MLRRVWLDPRARLGLFRSHLCLITSAWSICLCLSVALWRNLRGLFCCVMQKWNGVSAAAPSVTQQPEQSPGRWGEGATGRSKWVVGFYPPMPVHGTTATSTHWHFICKICLSLCTSRRDSVIINASSFLANPCCPRSEWSWVGWKSLHTCVYFPNTDSEICGCWSQCFPLRCKPLASPAGPAGEGQRGSSEDRSQIELIELGIYLWHNSN